MLTAGIVVALAGAALLIVLITRKPDVAPADEQFFAEFSADRYRPMARLLDERDYAYLASRPGVGPALLRRLRRERRRILRSYLRLLEQDFFRIHGAVATIAQSANTMDLCSRPAWIRRRLRFQFRLAVAHGRLLLSAWGFGGVSPALAMEFARSLEALAGRVGPLSAGS